ncbi:MAG: LemA family protein [Vallitaleaceae bacterium]|jgi:LemA protein|nr:LemA family protein [Vallitaleaceae bacterium]
MFENISLGYVLIVIIIIIILAIVGTFNKLAKLNINVKESFSTMDVFLKKRYDLIPNLVETLKGYEAYESSTLKSIVEARQQALSSTNNKEIMVANQAITSGLDKIFALAEAYPDLKANLTYVKLQEALESTEKDIANARLYYNGNVKLFNKSIVTFPVFLFANLMGFKAYDFFEISNDQRENVKINLTE